MSKQALVKAVQEALRSGMTSWDVLMTVQGALPELPSRGPQFPPARLTRRMLRTANRAVKKVGRDQKITAIKEVRFALGCGLKEAKEAVEHVLAGRPVG